MPVGNGLPQPSGHPAGRIDPYRVLWSWTHTPGCGQIFVPWCVCVRAYVCVRVCVCESCSARYPSHSTERAAGGISGHTGLLLRRVLVFSIWQWSQGAGASLRSLDRRQISNPDYAPRSYNVTPPEFQNLTQATVVLLHSKWWNLRVDGMC